jgi:hypothetical protein
VESICQEDLQGIFLVLVTDTQEVNIPFNVGFVGGEDKVESQPVLLMVGVISPWFLPPRSAASKWMFESFTVEVDVVAIDSQMSRACLACDRLM